MNSYGAKQVMRIVALCILYLSNIVFAQQDDLSSSWNQHYIYILYCLVKCVSDVQGLWSESIFEKRPCKALYSTAWGVVVWRESYSFGEVLSKVDENSWLNSSACVVCMCLCLSWPAPGRSAKEWAQIENTQAKKLTHWAPKKTKRNGQITTTTTDRHN